MKKNKDNIFFVESKVIKIKEINSLYFTLLLEAKDIARKIKPAQFVGITLPFFSLPRFFSIYDKNDKCIELLIKKVGRGTAFLANIRKGEKLWIRGPLGKPFSLFSSKIVGIGGGSGVAAVRFFLKYYSSEISHSILICGEKSSQLVPIRNITSFHKVNEIFITVEEKDSSSKYFCGTPIEVLEILFKKGKLLGYKVITCGPIRMMDKITQLCKKYNTECYVFLEQKMACGTGDCMGCTIPVLEKDNGEMSYKRVCKEGPVFLGNNIVWEQI